jgi:hypothetical protein
VKRGNTLVRACMCPQFDPPPLQLQPPPPPPMHGPLWAAAAAGGGGIGAGGAGGGGARGAGGGGAWGAGGGGAGGAGGPRGSWMAMAMPLRALLGGGMFVLGPGGLPPPADVGDGSPSEYDSDIHW